MDKKRLNTLIEEIAKTIPNESDKVGINRILSIELHRIADALEELVKNKHRAKVKVPGEMPTLGG